MLTSTSVLEGIKSSLKPSNLIIIVEPSSLTTALDDDENEDADDSLKDDGDEDDVGRRYNVLVTTQPLTNAMSR